MKNNEKKYRRLPGKKRKFLGKDSLWEARDHLLLVSSIGMSENYRRFYYKDIKSIVVAKTRTAFYKTLFVLCCLVAFSSLGLYLWQDNMNPAAAPFGILSAFFLGYFLVCLLGGPSCDCWVITAVRKEKLTPCQRLRPTLKMVNTLKTHIEEIQGKLDRESLDRIESDTLTARAHNTLFAPSETEPVDDRGLWHKGLFILFLLVGGFSLIMLVNRSTPVLIIGSIVFLVLCIVQVGALVRQAGSNLTPGLKKLTWAGLVFVVMSFAQSYVEMMYLFFNSTVHTNPAIDQMAYFRMYAEMDPFDHPVFLTLDLIFAGASFVLGLWGLILLKRRARS